MKSSLMVVGYFIFIAGVASNLVYFFYHGHPFEFGIALGYGVISILGLVVQLIAVELRRLQARIDNIEPVSQERTL
jgi:hypothetical protein